MSESRDLDHVAGVTWSHLHAAADRFVRVLRHDRGFGDAECCAIGATLMGLIMMLEEVTTEEDVDLLAALRAFGGSLKGPAKTRASRARILTDFADWLEHKVKPLSDARIEELASLSTTQDTKVPRKVDVELLLRAPNLETPEGLRDGVAIYLAAYRGLTASAICGLMPILFT